MKRCCCSKRIRRTLRKRLRGIRPRRTWMAWIWTKRDGTESKPVSSKKQIPKHAINSAKEIKKERKKAKPKTKKPAKSQSIIAIVKSFGGINPRSLSFRASYSGIHEALSDGIPLGIFNKKGRGLDDIAQELHGAGHIMVPESEHGGAHLLSLIQSRALSVQADLEAQIKRAEQDYIDAEREAYEAGYTTRQIEDSARDGEEEGISESSTQEVGDGLRDLEERDGDESFDFGANVAESQTEGPAGPPNVSIDDIPKGLAENAYHWVSMDPEGRGQRDRAQYVEIMRFDWDELSGLATTPDKMEVLKEEFERYRKGYVEKKKAVLSATSRTASPFVTGGSKFPTERNRKRQDTEHKRMNELVEFREKAKAAIAKKLDPPSSVIKASDPDAIDSLREQLDREKTTREQWKAMNAAHKKFLKDPKSLESSPIPESAKEIVRNYKPSVSWEPHPIASFQLTNLGANIRRIEKRIANLEKEKAASKVSSNVPDVPGLRIEEDPDAMRIKLLFDGKPEPDVIAKLKKHGFRWSPTNKAWQRQLNNAGRYAAQTFVKSVSGTA